MRRVLVSLVFGVALSGAMACCDMAAAPEVGGEVGIAAPEGASAVVAKALRRGLLTFDPLATARRAEVVAVAHERLAVRPISGALVVFEEDLRLPVEGGELVLLRAWRHTPGLELRGSWDEHFGLGPASAYCAEGARCDGEQRVTALAVGDVGVGVTWSEGHPAALSVGGREFVRLSYKDGALAELVATRPGDPRPPGSWPMRRSYGRDGGGRLVSVAGEVKAAYTYDGWGQLTGLERGGLRYAVTYDGAGRVTGIESEGRTTRLAFKAADEVAGGRGATTEVVVTQSGLAERRFTEQRDTAGTEVTMTFGGRQVRWRMDAEGRVVGYEDGGVTRFAWEGRDLVEVVRPGGLTQRVSRAAGRVVAVDEGGRRVGFGYDAAGRLVSMSDSERGPDPVVSWTRDAAGRVIGVVDGGRKEVWTRDEAGRVTRMEDDQGARLEMTWDGSGQVASVRDERGYEVGFGYDVRGRLTEKRYPDGTKETFQWGDDDQIVALVDRLGRTTSLSYDRAGRRVAALSGGARVTSTWDALGRPIREETPAGLSTWSWDLEGRLTGLTTPEGEVRFSLDRLGRRTETRVEGEVVERLTWGAADGGTDDGAGRLRSREAGEVTETFGYDARGRVARIEVRGARVSDLRYEYPGDAVLVSDALDGSRWRYERRGGLGALDGSLVLVSAVGPGGAADAYRYGPRGEIVAKTSVLGDGFEMRYDAAGRPIAVDAARGGVTRLEWDAAGRWTSSEAGGVKTELERDPAGRVVTVREGGARWAAEYDGGSTRLAALIDPAGRRTTFAYEGGRLVSATSPVNTRRWSYEGARVVGEVRGDGRRASFEFDGEGRLSAWKVDDQVVRQVARDAAGLVVRDEGPGHRVEITRGEREVVSLDRLRGVRVARLLDEAARVSAVTIGGGQEGASAAKPGGDAAGRGPELEASPSRSVRYERRGDGLVTRVRGPDGFEAEVVRDALGRWTGYRYAGGAALRASFDEARRVIGIEVVGADGGVVYRAAWSYDAAGRVTLASVDGENTTFAYDAAGRLARETVGLGAAGETRFEYAPSGELLRKGELAIAVDEAGRPARVGAREWRYAADGALIARGDERLETDLAGRLARVTRGEAGIVYRYDGDGRLVSRAEGGRTQSFVWDAGGLVAAFDGEVFEPARATLFVSEPEGARLGLVKDGAARYLVTGPDGATLAVIDGAGQVMARYRHGAYGEAKTSGDGALDPLHYRGHFTDPTTGLIHFPLRWYDPEAGAFIAPDPDAGDLLRPRTLARYAYLEGDPVNRVDPWGAAGHEWQMGSSCLEAVCDLFQKGKIEATYASGKALDGFNYIGAIEKKGWVYDLWNKRIPGSDKVITIIRDLNEKAEGPFGKPNFSGNIVINPATPQHIGQGASGASGAGSTGSGGLIQTIRDGLTQVKQGIELHGKEVAGTVGGLGGLSGTLGAEVSTIAVLPGGFTIIGAGVAVAGAGGYGTGVLINMIPGVPEAAQAAISSVMGYPQDQALADLQAQAAAEGKAAADARAKVIGANLDKDKGRPSEPKVGVAGGPVGLDPLPPEPNPAPTRPERPEVESPEPDTIEPEDTEGDTAAPPFDILAYVKAKKIVMNFTETIDASAGEFKNVITCHVTMTFWNVGAMAPGYGGISASSTCTASINGQVSKSSVGGTFSGGPNGVFTFSSPSGSIQAQMSGGTTVTFPDIGSRAVPEGAFDDWPATLPPH